MQYSVQYSAVFLLTGDVMSLLFYFSAPVKLFVAEVERLHSYGSDVKTDSVWRYNKYKVTN